MTGRGFGGCSSFTCPGPRAGADIRGPHTVDLSEEFQSSSDPAPCRPGPCSLSPRITLDVPTEANRTWLSLTSLYPVSLCAGPAPLAGVWRQDFQGVRVPPECCLVSKEVRVQHLGFWAPLDTHFGRLGVTNFKQKQPLFLISRTEAWTPSLSCMHVDTLSPMSSGSRGHRLPIIPIWSADYQTLIMLYYKAKKQNKGK